MTKWQYLGVWLAMMGACLIIGGGIWWEIHRVVIAILAWLKVH